MAEYRLLTLWRIEAPLQRVFDAISDSLRWPEWWAGADRVEELRAGDADGVGGLRRYTWKSRLSYRLSFDAVTTRVEAPRLLEACVSGDLEGSGRWTFEHEAGITLVRYEWHVRSTRRWMNLAAPAVRSMFVHNHHALMQQGEKGLASLLGCRLHEAVYCEQPPAGRRPLDERIDWPAAMAAGITAGVVATIVQMILWEASSIAATDMLLRDARLAAAIVMGARVLPPPASFDWNVMLAATTVHFALSTVYGVLQAPVAARLSSLPAALAGCALGLLLYAVNMYGFTAIFPWFAASRDWITVTAHVSFGMTAAIAYKCRGAFAAALEKRPAGTAD